MMVLLGYFLIAAIAAVIASTSSVSFLPTSSSVFSKLPIEYPDGKASWLLELEKKDILILAVGASSAFLVTKLKLAWPVC